jgi:hypothetical protein
MQDLSQGGAFSITPQAQPTAPHDEQTQDEVNEEMTTWA